MLPHSINIVLANRLKLVVFASLLVAACDGQRADDIDAGEHLCANTSVNGQTNYFPLNVGDELAYDYTAKSVDGVGTLLSTGTVVWTVMSVAPCDDNVNRFNVLEKSKGIWVSRREGANGIEEVEIPYESQRFIRFDIGGSIYIEPYMNESMSATVPRFTQANGPDSMVVAISGCCKYTGGSITFRAGSGMTDWRATWKGGAINSGSQQLTLRSQIPGL